MLGYLTRIQHPDPQGDIRYNYDGTGAAHGVGIGRLIRIEDRHSRIDYLDKHWVIALDSAERSVNNTSSQTAIQISWLHSDDLLAARAATDADQNLIWRWYGDAFGNGKAESLAQTTRHALTLNLRFPGQYYDEESGLHYNYFRTYDPQQGRYTQSDPIGLMGGVNTYLYAYLSPALWYDRLGLEAGCDVMAINSFKLCLDNCPLWQDSCHPLISTR